MILGVDIDGVFIEFGGGGIDEVIEFSVGISVHEGVGNVVGIDLSIGLVEIDFEGSADFHFFDDMGDDFLKYLLVIGIDESADAL